MKFKDKIIHAHTCHYCNHTKYPNGRLILPEDKHARKTERGDWKCGVCVAEESKELLKLNRGLG